MSIVFLTSSPTGSLDGKYVVDGIDENNQFRSNLKKYWKQPSKCLMISAFPEDTSANDEMRAWMEHTLQKSQLMTIVVDIWDNRTTDFSREMLHSYDVVILGGGHVPTENAFFHRIALREKIRDFRGIVIGISAGTMNSADVVYAQPELLGEAINPTYKRFLIGLGLTKTQILPHYQMVKDYVLDGMRLYEDITFGDGYGREFLVLPDGSYLFIQNGNEIVYGEAYRIANGFIQKVCENGKSIKWTEL